MWLIGLIEFVELIGNVQSVHCFPMVNREPLAQTRLPDGGQA